MVHLQTSFFTDAVVAEIRTPRRGARLHWRRTTDNKTFFNKNWPLYRAFHSRFEKVSSKNAVFIMNEFRNKCETISSVPKQFMSPRDLALILSRNELY
jgi:hypothetical protein